MGVGAEVANAETVKDREERRDWSQSGRKTHLMLPMVYHNVGGMDITQKQNKQRVKSQKGDGNTGMEKGLTIHEDTRWRSPTVAG